MKRTINHIILFLFVITAHMSMAQSQKITGIVLDTDQNPVEGAVIILYDETQSILHHDVTLEEGSFTFTTQVKPGFSIEITHLAFEKKQYEITPQEVTQKVINLQFVLNASVQTLDEVVFIGKHKLKDTINFDLNKLNLYAEDNLQEILKKIPDFRLGDNGSIIYKGKNIDKILVNSKPSFVSQNSIALESVENKIIEGISLINNYSDDFSMDFDENEESVINIDTKNKNQNILNGDIEANYGYKDKYEFKGKGFLFSRALNAFATHNTNTVGKTTINSDEVKKLFSEGQPFSPYQGESLGALFSSNENLQKDFFTSTNITLRNQTQRLKTSGLIYHIAPDRINSVLQNSSTLNDLPLFNSSSMARAQTQSLLGAASVAFKASNRTILKYNVNSNYIDEKNSNTTENEFFENGTSAPSIQLFSNNNNEIFSGYHQLSMESKLQKNLILVTKGGYFHEDTKFLNDYTISEDSHSLTDLQDYKFDKNEVQGSIALRYKLSNAFIPILNLQVQNTDETILNQESTTSLIHRSIENYLANLTIRGADVMEGMDYGLDLGMNAFTNQITQESAQNKLFVPVSFWFDYERRLHRYNLKFERKRRFNELASGITTIQPFNTIWIGDTNMASGFNTSHSLKASYNYDNLFDAEIFSISFSYQEQKGAVRRAFIGQENGISQFQLFQVDKAKDFKISSYYSKTIFPLHYPTKIDLTVKYMQSEYPLQAGQQEIEVKNQNIGPSILIETITDNFVNFMVSSKMFFMDDQVENTSFKSTYMSNEAGILLKNNVWKGNISFLFDNNIINGNIFTRTNVNLGISYSTANITYRIESRHLGELLGVFENEAYNSQFFIRNGIASTIVNNQSLNYITLGIKYKL
ncbi:MAG: carboxypeptidase-like regulatory domain-containing protein [Saprospiraceae bacterium]|nr:carboxypeptidase-like regulatory domain-containing protein [Saprospiraceae bacterium]